MEATGSTATGNAIGIAEVSSGSATVDLLCGIQVKGSVSLSAGDVERPQRPAGAGLLQPEGRTVPDPPDGRRSSGPLNTETGRLGSRELADNVIIFQNDGSGLTAVSLSQLTQARSRRPRSPMPAPTGRTG